MAIFKRKDRNVRNARKALHASAMYRARQVFGFAGNTLPDSSARTAWDEYVQACAEYMILPVAFSAFKRELLNA